MAGRDECCLWILYLGQPLKRDDFALAWFTLSSLLTGSQRGTNSRRVGDQKEAWWQTGSSSCFMSVAIIFTGWDLCYNINLPSRLVTLLPASLLVGQWAWSLPVYLNCMAIRAPRILSLHSSTEISHLLCRVVFYMDAEDLDECPHVCTSSAHWEISPALKIF